ncbi:MAG TPA: hypothetical protein VGA03_01965 [Anaerolineales bacterium]
MPGRAVRDAGLERDAAAGTLPFGGAVRRAAGLPLGGSVVRFVFEAVFFAGLDVFRAAIRFLFSVDSGR